MFRTSKSKLIMAILLTLLTAEELFAENRPEYNAEHLSKIAREQIDWENKDEGYWRRVLNRKQYAVCREAGTERAGTGFYNKHDAEGVYHCSSCGLELFSSKTKFDSGTGWPSFYQAMERKNIELKEDYSFFGAPRTEVVCARCKAHLGHVFNDGPRPTGKRYCINSVCLIHNKHLKK